MDGKTEEKIKELINICQNSEIDYSTYNDEDILYLREMCAEKGVEMTPEEVKQCIQLIIEIQS